MPIITISRGSYNRGKEVAEKVAQKLGYRCISREVLLEASKEWNVPEVKLTRAIHDAPSFLYKFTYGKDKYISFIQSALLKQLQDDNVVYHGLAGHFFLEGVSHTLKVRIIADTEERVKLVMEREGGSEKDALRVLTKDDSERRKWAEKLYGIDTSDPSLYDLVIRVRKFTVDDAAEIICQAVGMEQFKTSPESQKIMDNLTLAAEVKAALVGVKPDIEVTAQDGVVDLNTRAPESAEDQLFEKMKAIATGISGVKEFKAHFLPISLFRLKDNK
jgi:cytidylate kinase